MSQSIVVPQFPMSAVADAVIAGSVKIGQAHDAVAAATDSTVSTVNALFSQFTDSLMASGTVPKDAKGRAAIRAEFETRMGELLADETPVTDAEGNEAPRGSVFDTVLTSGFVVGVNKKTLSQYLTGAVLCYFAGVAWFPRAANPEDDGGCVRPDWWKLEQQKRSESVKNARSAKSAKAKPSKATVWNADSIRAAATELLEGIRAIHGSGASDKVLDTLMVAIPGFKLKV